MQLIDTPNAVAVMPTPAGTATPGHFDDSDPLAVTRLSADWCNAVQGEIANLITGLGGTLNKALVNQLATLIVPLLKTAGSWTDKIEVGKIVSTFLTLIDTKTTDANDPIPGVGAGFVETDMLYARMGLNIGPSGSGTNAIDDSRNAHLNNVVAAGYLSVTGKISTPAGADTVFDNGIDVEGTTTLRGKVKNASAADVVFDDGVTVEGKGTLTGGLETVAPVTVTATWSTDHWEATINEVGGRVEIPFDSVTHLLNAGDSIRLNITNSKIDAASRVYYSCENYGNVTGCAQGAPVFLPCGPSDLGAGVIYNLAGLLDAPITIAFDVINPA